MVYFIVKVAIHYKLPTPANTGQCTIQALSKFSLKNICFLSISLSHIWFWAPHLVPASDKIILTIDLGCAITWKFLTKGTLFLILSPCCGKFQKKKFLRNLIRFPVYLPGISLVCWFFWLIRDRDSRSENGASYVIIFFLWNFPQWGQN